RRRRSSISTTVRPRLWVTTTAPASANTLFSCSIDSAFCARSIVVSSFGIRRRAYSRRRIWLKRHASLHSVQAGRIVRRKRGPPAGYRQDESSLHPHLPTAPEGSLDDYDAGDPRIPKFSDRHHQNRSPDEMRALYTARRENQRLGGAFQRPTRKRPIRPRRRLAGSEGSAPTVPPRPPPRRRLQPTSSGVRAGRPRARRPAG